MGQQQPSEAIRFGAFEVDLVAGELRKSGIKIKLQDQPFNLLAALLERPGEVVTREKLRQRLWPEDTYVDFDRSLNTAASRAEALEEVTDLLASAYLRYAAIRRVPTTDRPSPAENPLDNRCVQSVHERS